jgi:hypothetical protein
MLILRLILTRFIKLMVSVVKLEKVNNYKRIITEEINEEETKTNKFN